MKLIYKVPEKTKYKNVREVLKVEFSISDRLLLKLKKLQTIKYICIMQLSQEI